MSLTDPQLVALRAACFADPTAAALIAAGNANELQPYLNAASTFVVWRASVDSSAIGPALNYVAVSSLTTANRDRATTFLTLNPISFTPTQDIESYWDSTFGGALGGEGANTRAALRSLWRRFATRAERMLATGTGTDVLPGTLTFAGDVSSVQAVRIVFRDDGTIWTQG